MRRASGLAVAVFLTALTSCARTGVEHLSKPRPGQSLRLRTPAHIEKILAEYGVLEGKPAQLMESGVAERVLRDGKAQQVVIRRGTGRDEVTITEHHVQEVAVRVKVGWRRYVDPIASATTDQISKMVYDRGLGLKLGTVITNRTDIESIARALREHTYEYDEREKYRSYRRQDGTVVAGRSLRTVGSSSHACRTALYVYLHDGSTTYIYGHLADGHISGGRFGKNPEVGIALSAALARAREEERIRSPEEDCQTSGAPGHAPNHGVEADSSD